MQKESISTKERIDNIVDLPKANALYKRSKTTSFIKVLVIGILFFIVLLFVPFDITEKQTIFLSIIGSILTSLLVVFVTINNEERHLLIRARKGANILSESLQFITNQIIQIQNGSRHRIYYPTSWIDYYMDCSTYLEYDYLGYIYSELQYVEKINYCLKNKNEDSLQRLLNQRGAQLTNHTKDFNIMEVSINLSWFARGERESKSWKYTENYKKFSNYFYDHYKNDVLTLSTSYLEINGDSKAAKVQKYVMVELRKDEKFLKENFNEFCNDDRAILNEIYKIYIGLDKKYDPLSLTWGELNLKKRQKGKYNQNI